MLRQTDDEVSWKSDTSSFDEEDGDTATNFDSEKDDATVIANWETTAVFRLRAVVFLVLLASSVAVSLTVFFIAKNAVDKEYKSEYDGAAERVLETFQDIAESKLGAVSSLGVAMISHGVDFPDDWPFVTLTGFQQRATTALKQSGCLFIKFAPEVKRATRDAWERFTVRESGWVEESLEYQKESGIADFLAASGISLTTEKNVRSQIWHYSGTKVVVDGDADQYFPVWQTSPLLEGGAIVNENVLEVIGTDGADVAYRDDEVVISEFVTAPPGGALHDHPLTSFFALTQSVKNGKVTEYKGDPTSRVFFPIYNGFGNDREHVALMVAWVHWASYFEKILPNTVHGIILVLDDNCGGVYTLEISGGEVLFLGKGDHHDKGFDDTRRTETYEGVENIADGTKYGLPLNQKFCPTKLSVYASKKFEADNKDITPILMTIAVAVVFVFTFFMFFVYDRLVERRQALVLREATQSSAIVSSLFPEAVRDRLMKSNEHATSNENGLNKGSRLVAQKSRLKGYLSGVNEDAEDNDQPIADLFPNCTVLFADIAGFTAWSSTREPSQVFILLQTVYQAFDVIAKRRKVFKVETIGDSYVAVTGLPEPQKHHAIIMARFAHDCLTKMNELTGVLVSSLGPDTTDLTMRVGLHSGPVTAGVLRGDRARFQLFGDTVNTAARMESTGIKGMIQISEETNSLLEEQGKGHWTSPRADVVNAKGKGTLQTYWLDPVAGKIASTAGSTLSGSTPGLDSQSIEERDPAALLKHDRLVDWMVEVLASQVKKIVAMNGKSRDQYDPKYEPNHGTHRSLDDVAEVIPLPRFNPIAFERSQKYKSITLDPVVAEQLREFVSIIASMYRNNSFHNFEHASHVTMATAKFLHRIVEPSADVKGDADKNGKVNQNYTQGINSDPLTVLAILMSALIHDVDHRGVSNMQLAKEEPGMGRFYNDKSVAEQNSLDISWELLMSDQFKALQKSIFRSDNDLKRFRQVLVNVVLATDIFDKEINDKRKKRWTKAFENGDGTDSRMNDLRGTIVLEHIIQASDVSHTMQHWHVYRKWNVRLFKELYLAYEQGRMGKDPSTFWYAGELGFFDNYVIPLAKKLESCGVFGVSSDECLNYARRNRSEWEDRGKEIVASMVEELKAEKVIGRE